MTINKETASLNVPWEKEYGYSQAVKVGDTIFLSGQVSHDSKGNLVGSGNMEMQMRQAYSNIQEVLAQYGATIDILPYPIPLCQQRLLPSWQKALQSLDKKVVQRSLG